MRTGLTFCQALPRRPAAYGAPSALTITPSWPASPAATENASASAGSEVTIQRTRYAPATRSSSASRVSSGSSSRSRPSTCSRSKKYGRTTASRGASAPNRLIVSAKARGRPSSASTIDSPSSTSRSAGSARTASTTSGSRCVTSLSERVNTRTWSPSRCTWIRAPSSFSSTYTRSAPANALSLNASATDLALAASIGPHRAQHLQADGGQARLTLGAGEQGGLGQRAGEHPRAAHRRRRHLRRRGHRLGERGVERPLPHLAHQHAGEEPALVGRRASQQRRQHRPAVGGRGRRGETVEGGVDVGHRRAARRWPAPCPRPPPPGRR